MELKHSFTSTGHKFFHHEEAMAKLRNGQGMPIVTHLMPTDVCQHTCAFCSVVTRDGKALSLSQIAGYLDQLVPIGLKSVIISGGGNPILFRCRDTGKGFNDLAWMIHSRGLEIGLITNGMPLKTYASGRNSWRTVAPSTLDLFKWIRISMSGLDHKEREVYVPDIDRDLTTLGFSYVYHDIYEEPAETNHGKVATPEEWGGKGRVQMGKDRLPWIQSMITGYVNACSPRYVRLLPNCNQPDLIASRCEELQAVANAIDPDVVFVQYKPPQAPNKCFLGYVHPVLNSDGYVYPCDSCVLNAAAGHKFAEPWRVCRWDAIGELYKRPVESLVDPKKLCPGCVFTQSNLILEQVVNGMKTQPPAQVPIHPNFV